MPRCGDISLSAYADPVARVYEEGERAPKILLRIVTSEYSAHHLQVLEGLEAVRKRPGMYIGSTDSRGLMHCVWEIIDNAVDEALAGNGKRIDIVLHSDSSVEVHDTGRGIPVDIEPRTGLSGVEVVFTKLHAGGKFGGGSYAASGGLHGVGASVVNALSERLDVEVDRGGKTWAMSFHRGEPGVFADKGEPSPDSPFTPFLDRSELRVKGKAPRGVTGTRIRYWADRQIFTKDAAFQLEELSTRARQTAFLVPGLEIVVRDQRHEEHNETSFRFDGGISEFAEYLATDAAITDTWRLTGSGTFTETVPVLQPTGAMVPTEVERECHVDIAVRWGTGYDTVTRSFVNIIATPKGGTHQQGFDQELLRVLRTQVEQNARRLKVGNDKLEKDDVMAGLTDRADRAPARAAVRGPDQGDPRHARRAPDRDTGGPQGARGAVLLAQARRQGADRAAARQGRRRDEGAHLRARPQGDPAPQERAGVLVAARRSSSTAARRTSRSPSCSSSRATRRSAPRRTPATASTRRCCRSAARSSTCRSPPSPTCSPTPSAPRSSR